MFKQLWIHLQIPDPDEVLVLKFNYGLLVIFCFEDVLIEIQSLVQVYIHALEIERKVQRNTSFQPSQNPIPTTNPNPQNPLNAFLLRLCREIQMLQM